MKKFSLLLIALTTLPFSSSQCAKPNNDYIVGGVVAGAVLIVGGGYVLYNKYYNVPQDTGNSDENTPLHDCAQSLIKANQDNKKELNQVLSHQNNGSAATSKQQDNNNNSSSEKQIPPTTKLRTIATKPAVKSAIVVPAPEPTCLDFVKQSFRNINLMQKDLEEDLTSFY